MISITVPIRVLLCISWQTLRFKVSIFTAFSFKFLEPHLHVIFLNYRLPHNLLDIWIFVLLIITKILTIHFTYFWSVLQDMRMKFTLRYLECQTLGSNNISQNLSFSKDVFVVLKNVTFLLSDFLYFITIFKIFGVLNFRRYSPETPK